MFMQIFCYLFISLFVVNAQALIIGNKSTAGEEKSLCRIIYRNQKGELLSTCSGTLVSSTKILTAKHCLEKAPTVSVECGYIGEEGASKTEMTTGGSKVMTKGLKFIETHTDIVINKDHKGANQVKNDLGVIELKSPINPDSIKPSLFKPNSVYDYFTNVGAPFDGPTPPEIRNDSECKMEGFGINNEGLSGTLHSAPVASFLNIDQSQILAGEEYITKNLSPKKRRMINTCVGNYNESLLPEDIIPLAKRLHEEMMFDSVLAPGDSGGPLLCRKKGTLPWTIVAVATAVSLSKLSQSSVGAVSTWQVLNQKDCIDLGISER